MLRSKYQDQVMAQTARTPVVTHQLPTTVNLNPNHIDSRPQQDAGKGLLPINTTQIKESDGHSLTA